MKKILTILMLTMAIGLTACHQDNDDYMTLATICLDGGDTLTIEKVQAMAHLTNLNSRHVTSSADFIGSKVQIELLRGAYQAHVEGILSYTDLQGKRFVRSFRAVSDYIELVGSGTSEAKLNIIFLD
jgi:hypothetical protein